MKGFISKILLFIGVIILFFFIKNLNLTIVSLSIISLGFKLTIILLLYVFSSVVIKAVRWQFLMVTITGTKISLGSSITANLAGIAGGSLLPGRIDLVKPLMMKNNYAIKMSQSLSALMIERALDLLILLLIAAVSFFLIPAQDIINGYVVLTFIVMVFITLIFLIFFPTILFKISTMIIRKVPSTSKTKMKIEEFITTVLYGFTSLRSRFFMGLMLFLSFLTIGLEVVRFYFLIYFLGIQATPAIIGFALSAAVIIGVIALIPGGIGVTEFSAAGIIIALLSTAPEEVIKSAVLIDRFLAYYILLLIGSIILIVSHLRTPRSQRF